MIGLYTEVQYILLSHAMSSTKWLPSYLSHNVLVSQWLVGENGGSHTMDQCGFIVKSIEINTWISNPDVRVSRKE